MSRRPPADLLGLAAALVALVVAPAVLPSFVVSILTLVVIGAILASSVNMLAGQVGLVSIGHAGIAAAAAYGVAWASVRGHGLEIQLGLAALVTLATSAIYALTTMRSRGIVFLMITLALGMIVFGLAFRLASITGGQNGLTGIARPEPIASTTAYHLFAVLVLGLALVALRTIERSPFGLMMRGVRDSETRMASLGYGVSRVKFQAVLLSGVLAGAAGILAVWHAEFMSPAAATFGKSALAVVMVILGGAGSLLGPLLGAVVVTGSEHWLSSYVERWPTVLGIVFILVVVFAPRGVLGELSAFAAGRRRRFTTGVTPATDASPLMTGSEDQRMLEKEEP